MYAQWIVYDVQTSLRPYHDATKQKNHTGMQIFVLDVKAEQMLYGVYPGNAPKRAHSSSFIESCVDANCQKLALYCFSSLALNDVSIVTPSFADIYQKYVINVRARARLVPVTSCHRPALRSQKRWGCRSSVRRERNNSEPAKPEFEGTSSRRT